MPATLGTPAALGRRGDLNLWRSTMTRRISVLIERDEDGYYAYAPELKGCQTQGDTLDEAMANIREAVALYLESLDDDDERRAVSALDVLTTSVEVPVG